MQKNAPYQKPGISPLDIVASSGVLAVGFVRNIKGWEVGQVVKSDVGMFRMIVSVTIGLVAKHYVLAKLHMPMKAHPLIMSQFHAIY